MFGITIANTRSTIDRILIQNWSSNGPKMVIKEEQIKKMKINEIYEDYGNLCEKDSLEDVER